MSPSHTQVATLAKPLMPAISWQPRRRAIRARWRAPRSHPFSQQVAHERTQIPEIDCESM